MPCGSAVPVWLHQLPEPPAMSITVQQGISFVSTRLASKPSLPPAGQGAGVGVGVGVGEGAGVGVGPDDPPQLSLGWPT